MLGRNPIHLSAATCLATPFLDRLTPAAAVGFSGLSMCTADVDALVGSGISPGDVRARLANAGLQLTELEAITNWLPGPARPTGPWAGLADMLEHATPERLCRLAASFGARSVLCVEMLQSGLDLAAKAEGFARTCRIAADHGLDVMLEFLPTTGIATLAEARAIVALSGATNGALMLDSWHCFRTGTALSDISALPAAIIGGLQISDGPTAPEPDLTHAMMHDRLMPGEGQMDVAALIAAVRATGCTVPLSGEVFSDAVNAMPISEVARRTAAAMRAVMSGNSGAQ